MPQFLSRFLLVLACGLAVAPSMNHAAAQTQPPAATAAPAQPTAPAGLRSPRATMQTFLEAVDRGDFTRVARTLDLAGAPLEAVPDIATKLLGVFNRIGRVEPRDLPDDRVVEASSLREFIFFPDQSEPAHRRLIDAGATGEIALAEGPDGAWRFSAKTVDNIDALYRQVESLPIVYGVDETSLSLPLRIRRLMPSSLRSEGFIGVEPWQWLGLLLVAFLSVFFDFASRLFFRSIGGHAIRRRGGEVEGAELPRAVRPFGLFVGALVALVTIRALGLPPTALKAMLIAIRLVLMVAGVWAAFRATDLVADVLARKAAGTDTRFDDLLIPLLRKTAKVFIFALGIVYIANALNVEILPLLTGLGIGGLAVAFAAKDTIENLFGSVAVILDKPFEVGDWVKVGDVEGTVEELGFRSTRIRTFYNSQVTVPNATLVRATVDNFGRRRYRRWTTHVGLEYGTPVEKIEAFCEGIRELVRVHPYTRKDYYQVWLHQFGAASLDVLVYVFHEAPDWQTELRERQRLMLDILRLAERLGVGIAFPTQTIHLVQDDRNAAKGGPSPASAAHIPPVLRSARNADQLGRNVVRELTKDASWRRIKPGPVTFDAPRTPVADDDDSQVESRVGGDA